jgi:hypothetical protein
MPEQACRDIMRNSVIFSWEKSDGEGRGVT